MNKTSADAKAALAAEQHGDHGNTAKDHDNSSAKQETHHNDTNEQNAGEKHHASHNHHDTGHSEEEKITHKLHQMHNRPWAALYVSLLFFLGITLLVLAFYAAQRVAQSGWSIVLFRVMEAITANLVPTSIIMLIVIVLTGMHFNHLFTWMSDGVFDKSSQDFDPIVYGKKLWLNTPGWIVRGILPARMEFLQVVYTQKLYR